MKKEFVGKVLGAEFGLHYKERVADGLWAKIYRDSPYEYVDVVDDDGNIVEEGSLFLLDNIEDAIAPLRKKYGGVSDEYKGVLLKYWENGHWYEIHKVS